MSLCKLCFFAILAAIVACAAGASLSPHIKPVGLGKRNAQPGGGAALAAAESFGSRPSSSEDELTTGHGRPHRVKVFGPESEMDASIFPVQSLPEQSLRVQSLPVQSKNTNDLSAGKLLVASRGLADPNFAQTVVLLVRYDAKGVVGLILNRRTDVPVSRVFEDLKAAKDRSDPVYLGGPVEMPAVFALFRSPAKVEGAERIFGGVYLITAKNLFEQTISARPGRDVFHVYLGYAGWDKEQLRKEVELGAWFIFPAEASTVFNSDPDSVWPQMIRKTELKFAGREPTEADRWTRAAGFLAVSYAR